MPYWTDEFIPFSPEDIPGLVSWYDSNSTVLSNDGLGDVLSWKDKSIYRNDLISYLGAIQSGNRASNLLPNSGSINASNIYGDVVFSNAVMTSKRGELEFQYETTGATIFVCGDFQDSENITENYVSVFTNNYSNPSSFNNNLTIGTSNRGGVFGSNFVNVYDLSNRTTSAINLSPTVVAWFDPNRGVNATYSEEKTIGFPMSGPEYNLNYPEGMYVETVSNLNRAFSNQDLTSGEYRTIDNYQLIRVIPNNEWNGSASIKYGCNIANVFEFPYSPGYTNINQSPNIASTAPQLTPNINDNANASDIRAIGFVVNYSSDIVNNDPSNYGNVISATYVDGTNDGAYFRLAYADAGFSNFNENDLIWSENAESTDGTGTYGGGLWVNGSNVFDATCNATPRYEYDGGPELPSYGAITRDYNLRGSFNIVFLRLGETRKTGIAISGLGDVRSFELANKRDFYGQIGDVIVLGPDYTTDDQYAVEGYLAQKYDLLGKLRSDHPYKTGYNGVYPFGPPPKSILTGIAFNNCNTVEGAYATGYFNGRPVAANSNVNIITTNPANYNMFVGDSCNYTAKDASRHNINAAIKEVIVYNRPLSEAEVGSVHNYLQEKHSSPPLYNNGNFTY
jgi:hypothetical protein